MILLPICSKEQTLPASRSQKTMFCASSACYHRSYNRIKHSCFMIYNYQTRGY
uniref:Uncharacterized protein n=1 Tax=Arundo donax TaxID=35708 RepID=A0A0A8XRD0_ARUDO